MAFLLKSGDDVAKGFRRIAITQIEACLQAADDPASQDAAPHAIRKRCKKLRGLLRLVRGSFDDYSMEQRAVRDEARRLAPVRESAAHLEAMERLCARDPVRYQDPDFEQARNWLESRRDATVREGRQHECVQEARAILRAQLKRARHWSLREKGFDAIGPGLVGTYRAARRALAEACDDPTAHHLHELRKHVKYHRFHLDLLHATWPRPMLALVDEAEDLGEILGEHHDIDVLLAVLGQDDAAPAFKGATRRIAVAARPEQARLEATAFRAARRLLAERRLCRHVVDQPVQQRRTTAGGWRRRDRLFQQAQAPAGESTGNRDHQRRLRTKNAAGPGGGRMVAGELSVVGIPLLGGFSSKGNTVR